MRERQPDDPPCGRLACCWAWRGSCSSAAAPELEAILDEPDGAGRGRRRVVVLRLKRARNPDMVCLERLQEFLVRMAEGARSCSAACARTSPGRWSAWFYRWLPRENVFAENGAAGSSTLLALRRGYELLAGDLWPRLPAPAHPGGRPIGLVLRDLNKVK